MTPDQALAQLHHGAEQAALSGDDAAAPADHSGAAAPVLLHTGVYAIYATPAGGRHLAYRPDGAAEDIHIPDIPAAAIGLVENFLTYGLPPQIVAMLGGKLSPVKLLSSLRQISGQMAAAEGNGAAAELEAGPDGGG